MNDDIEVLGVVEGKGGLTLRGVKRDHDGIVIEQRCNKLRQELLKCESYWNRKSILLTESDKIPTLKLKVSLFLTEKPI